MGAFSGHYIDSAKVKALANEGLCVTKIANILGHSRTGVKFHCIVNGIDYRTADKCKYITLYGFIMPLGVACELKGVRRESVYGYRAKRGLNEQDGFDAYIAYLASTKTKRIVRK